MRHANYMPSSILASSILVTFVVNPWSNFDPINLPKMFMLTGCACAILISLLLNYESLKKVSSSPRILILVFIISLCISLYFSRDNLRQSFWGTWGRNTGFLTYFSLSVILLASASIRDLAKYDFIIKYFLRASYFFSFYVLIQYMELDPVAWSQLQPFGTLGNINFMSGFLGLVCILMIGKVILYKEETYTSRAFFLLMTVGNLLLIWFTGSIQGIAIFLSGVVVYVLVYGRNVIERLVACLIALSMIIFGFVVFLGTAGIGPLRTLLTQDSVLLRSDYWRAGWRMFSNNWSFGVGLDSYGDYYRLYRDTLAVERTGPQRVANTAHNVFLDLLSGGGIFVGLSYFFLFTACILVAKRNWRNYRVEPLTLTVTATCVGYFIFCLISINQIGVAVWGSVFLGILWGILSLDNDKELRSGHKESFKILDRVTRTSSLQNSEFSATEGRIASPRKWVGTSAGFIIGIAVSLPPMRADINYFGTARAGNLVAAEAVLDMPGAQDIYWERLIERFQSTNEHSKSLALARDLVIRNPRSWTGWSTIWLSGELVSNQEKQKISRVLLSLDPNNVVLRQELSLWDETLARKDD